MQSEEAVGVPLTILLLRPAGSESLLELEAALRACPVIDLQTLSMEELEHPPSLTDRPTCVLGCTRHLPEDAAQRFAEIQRRSPHAEIRLLINPNDPPARELLESLPPAWLIPADCQDRRDIGHVIQTLNMLQQLSRRRVGRVAPLLGRLAKRFSPKPGQDLLMELVVGLNEALGTAYAFVGEFSGGENPIVQVHAFAKGTSPQEPFEYPLEDTPCASVREGTLCLEPINAAERYPKDLALADMGVEAYLGTPIRDSQNRPIGLLVLLDTQPRHDLAVATPVLDLVAARAAAEIERRRTLEDLALQRNLLEQINEAIAVCDQEGRVRYWNRGMSQLTGISQETAIDHSLEALFSTEQKLPPISEDMATLLEGHENPKRGASPHLIRETQWNSPQGMVHHLRLTRSLCRKADGTPDGIIQTLDDLTKEMAIVDELEKAKDRAETANRTKSEFLAVMSHEIRTPMNSILGFSELMAETELSEGQQEYLSIIQNNSQHLLDLINDILDFSRLESGVSGIDPQPVNLRNLVMQVVDTLWLQGQRKGIELASHIDQTVPVAILSNEAELRRLLLNLAGNAVKFTDEGSVKISAEAIPVGDTGRHRLSLWVQDTGIGIDPAEHERVFQPFIQVDSSQRRRFGGTGLGLAICRKIAQLLGGRLTMESVPGHGTQFLLELEVTETQPNPETPPPTLPSPLQSEGETHYTKVWESPEANDDEFEGNAPMRLLVADDEPMNRLLLARLLKKLGYPACLVPDGKAAIKSLQENPADVVLLDLQMPGLDGKEVAWHIRQSSEIEGASSIFLAAVTAAQAEQEWEKCLKVGFDDFLTKPIRKASLASLLDRAASALANRRLSI